MKKKEKSGVLNDSEELEDLVKQVEPVDNGLTVAEELQLEEKIRQEELEDRTGFEWREEVEDC